MVSLLLRQSPSRYWKLYYSFQHHHHHHYHHPRAGQRVVQITRNTTASSRRDSNSSTPKREETSLTETTNDTDTDSNTSYNITGSTTTTGESSANEELLKSPAKKIVIRKQKYKQRQSPILLFPWRSEDTIPTRLLQRKDNFSSNFISYDTSRMSITALTARAYLNIPIWKMLLSAISSTADDIHNIDSYSFSYGYGGWKQELADSCTWAFTQGIASILSNQYNVPYEKIIKDDDDDEQHYVLKFDSTHQGEEENEQFSTTNNSNNIMETKLQNLFSSAYENGKEQIQVTLHCKPIKSYLHSLHALPGLSRSLADNYPDLLQEIQQARSSQSHKRQRQQRRQQEQQQQQRQYTLSPSDNRDTDQQQQQQQQQHESETESETSASALSSRSQILNRVMAETGQVQTTIFADILIYCEEIFCVKNLETGETIQGYSDGKIRPVIHNVRFERVMTLQPPSILSSLAKEQQQQQDGGGGGGGGHDDRTSSTNSTTSSSRGNRTWSNWLITDIDDLLDGNKWYNPSGVTHWFYDG